MTPQERDLIERLFARLAAQPTEAKDLEAVGFINEKIRTLSDPGYTLVHTIAVQEIGLQQAQARIAELERQVAAAQSAAPAPSFLGSLFGSRPATPPPAQPVGAFSSVPQQQPVYQQAPVYQQQQAPQAGSFMGSILGTATGVAGGVLAAEAITSLFSHHGGGYGYGGGGYGGAGYGGGPWGGGGETVINETVVNNTYYGDQSGGGRDYAGSDTLDNDYASNDSFGSDSGGGDFGGGDWG